MSIISFVFNSFWGPWLFYGFMIFITYVICQVIANKMDWIGYDEATDAKIACFACGLLWPLTLIVIIIAIIILFICNMGDKAVKYILRMLD